MVLPPFDYFVHRSACQRKQQERLQRIRDLPDGYHTPLTKRERVILDQPIAELVRGVQDGEADPHDVLRAYGKAAVKAHEETNALTEIMVREAHTALDGEINLKGPLAGIPVSLKDSIIVKGFDATVGYSCNTFRPYEEDGAIVRLLKDAGAVPFVKTALPVTLLSFESFNDVWGRCLNPHNPKYSPGGSTGGEGALLAFGGSRIGIGSDVAGSVRAPAHYSGCYSLRCSTGRWPKAGVSTSMPGQEGIPSVFSPMARTLSDLTYFTRSIIQMKPWTYDHTVHPLPWRPEIEESYLTKPRLKIGILLTDGVVDPSTACLRALQTASTALSAQGHAVIPIAPPPPLEALVIASNLLNADGTRTFRSFFRTGESDDPGARLFGAYMRLVPRALKWLHWAFTKYVLRDHIWAALLEHWHEKSARQHWQWAAKREAYKARWHEWWDSFGGDDTGEDGLDFILTPPNALPALPHGAMASAAPACGYTFLFNLLDYTAGIVPVTRVDRATDGLGREVEVPRMNGVARGAYRHYDAHAMHGLPVAVQVVGRRLEEEKILACMRRVEDALEEHGERYALLDVL